MDIDLLNKQLAPVFRLVGIVSAGSPGGCPAQFQNSSELITHWTSVAAGVGVQASPALSRIYWDKLLRCEQSSKEQIAFAHAQLIMFTGVVTEDGNTGPAFNHDGCLHSILEAGEHAELAAQAGFGDAPNLLKLARVLHDKTIPTHVTLRSRWTHFWNSWDAWLRSRQAKLDGESAKKLVHPSHYKCASPSCRLETSAGAQTRLESASRISKTGGGQCHGSCKPRYCSKECQVADWKSHKPFCKPGLARSVDAGPPPTRSALEKSLRIDRHDVIAGRAGLTVRETPTRAGHYSVNLQGIEVQSSRDHLSAANVKSLMAMMSK
ncbi:hypothetical protein R3P38DRAFT_2527087 [Favolaschia claudopus]|uniref:MYND-type domain-containing protein n=1 Tax=Favolaschia claudopus TaxID=2862362 RepID=A0AAW0BL72_9AGAR